MNLNELIRTYAHGKGEEVMLESIRRVSDFVESHKGDDPDDYEDLKRDLYSMMVGCHFDERWGRRQIRQLYYTDESGEHHAAPYWSDDELHNAWLSVRSSIPSTYTEWDFYVTLNMIYSDWQQLIARWFPETERDELTERCVEMAVQWLNDPDSQYSDCKIWCYFE